MNIIAARDPPFICIGHRGACGYEPENTLASFRLAMDMGCPWIELDVYAVGGELIVIHDNRLERTTNGKGKVMNVELAYLRSLDAGKGEQIPTLDEVMELVADYEDTGDAQSKIAKTNINIELKGPGTADPVSEFLNKACETGWSADCFLLSSFNHEELAKADPVFRRGALFPKLRRDYLDIAKGLGAYSVNLHFDLASPEVIRQIHEQALKVYAYTVNNPQDIARMIHLGADGVFTNYPDRVFELLSNT